MGLGPSVSCGIFTLLRMIKPAQTFIQGGIETISTDLTILIGIIIVDWYIGLVTQCSTPIPKSGHFLDYLNFGALLDIFLWSMC